MFTHLLAFLIADVVFAQPQRNGSTPSASRIEPSPWPEEESILATVHGVTQQAPHSGRTCVYVEWAVGKIVNQDGKESWASFVQPKASREPLVFHAKGRDPIRVHPSIVRFWLVPSFVGPAPMGDRPKTPKGDLLTVKEFCLVDGQSVYVKRTQTAHLLPPEPGASSPPVQLDKIFVVSAMDEAKESTPSTMLR